MFLYAKVEKFQLIFSAELRQILFVSYFFCHNIVSLFANLDHSIGARILFVYSHYRIATTRRRCLNLAKTNPSTPVLSSQIKLYCYGVVY